MNDASGMQPARQDAYVVAEAWQISLIATQDLLGGRALHELHDDPVLRKVDVVDNGNGDTKGPNLPEETGLRFRPRAPQVPVEPVVPVGLGEPALLHRLPAHPFRQP